MGERPSIVVSARRLLLTSAILGPGIVAALVAHAVFWAAERAGMLGSGYLEHPHASATPSLLIGVLVFIGAAVVYALQAARERSRADIVRAARAFGYARAPWPLVEIAAVAVAALAAMEASEHAVGSAFGSSPFVGIALVVGIALAVGWLFRHFARWIADATEYLAAVLRFVRRAHGAPPAISDARFDAFRRARRISLGRVRGNRAPPFVLA